MTPHPSTGTENGGRPKTLCCFISHQVSAEAGRGLQKRPSVLFYLGGKFCSRLAMCWEPRIGTGTKDCVASSLSPACRCQCSLSLLCLQMFSGVSTNSLPQPLQPFTLTLQASWNRKGRDMVLFLAPLPVPYLTNFVTKTLLFHLPPQGLLTAVPTQLLS